MPPFSFQKELSELPSDPSARHEEFVDFFGQFLFWLRNSSLERCRELIESEDSRQALGAIHRQYYERVAQMPKKGQEAAVLLVEATLDGFIKHFAWLLGDEGTDARFGSQHAYRFRVEMEIVDVETGQVIEEQAVNRGGRFFGSYWGRWLNRYSSKTRPGGGAENEVG